MAIPDYQTVMLPLLTLVASQGPIKLRGARRLISDQFNLTEQEQSALLLSGKQPIIYNRVGWASTYLRKAGLIALPQRGVMEVTDRGRKVLSESPTAINVKYLERFPEFIEFRTVVDDDEAPKSSAPGCRLSSQTRTYSPPQDRRIEFL